MADPALCPLVFEPLYKRRIWGGQRLRALFGKQSSTAGPIGETWEVVDLEQEQSVARTGTAARHALHDLVERWGPALLGTAQLIDGRFPLLVKFLDAREALSVQVHPRRAGAAGDGTPVRTKDEMWYVLEAAPGSVVYHGLLPGVDRAGLAAAVRQGRVESVLRGVPAKSGAVFYLPSGCVHALGAGCVVAEVSTASDTTFRLYDWGRVDPATGQPRPLHIEQALDHVDFGPLDPAPLARSHVSSVWTTVTRLVTAEAFIVERVRMAAGVEQAVPYADLVIWIVLAGRGEVGYNGGRHSVGFRAGDVVVLPAELNDGVLKTQDDCVWLEVTAPNGSSLAQFDRPARERREDGLAGLARAAGLVQLGVPRG